MCRNLVFLLKCKYAKDCEMTLSIVLECLGCIRYVKKKVCVYAFVCNYKQKCYETVGTEGYV